MFYFLSPPSIHAIIILALSPISRILFADSPVITDVTTKTDAAVITFKPATVPAGGEPITGYTASCQSNSAVDAAGASKNPPGKQCTQ